MTIQSNNIYKIASRNELEEATSDGWRLVQILHDKVESSAVVAMTNPAHDPYRGYDPNVINNNDAFIEAHQPKVIGEILFLLTKSTSVEVIANLNESLEKQKAEIKKNVLDSKALKEKFDNTVYDFKITSKMVEAMKEDLAESEDIRKRMEIDIAKIRKTIGEREMKKILNEIELE